MKRTSKAMCIILVLLFSLCPLDVWAESQASVKSTEQIEFSNYITQLLENIDTGKVTSKYINASGVIMTSDDFEVICQEIKENNTILDESQVFLEALLLTRSDYVGTSVSNVVNLGNNTYRADFLIQAVFIRTATNYNVEAYLAYDMKCPIQFTVSSGVRCITYAYPPTKTFQYISIGDGTEDFNIEYGASQSISSNRLYATYTITGDAYCDLFGANAMNDPYYVSYHFGDLDVQEQLYITNVTLP